MKSTPQNHLLSVIHLLITPANTPSLSLLAAGVCFWRHLKERDCSGFLWEWTVHVLRRRGCHCQDMGPQNGVCLAWLHLSLSRCPYFYLALSFCPHPNLATQPKILDDSTRLVFVCCWIHEILICTSYTPRPAAFPPHINASLTRPDCLPPTEGHLSSVRGYFRWTLQSPASVSTPTRPRWWWQIRAAPYTSGTYPPTTMNNTWATFTCSQ